MTPALAGLDSADLGLANPKAGRKVHLFEIGGSDFEDLLAGELMSRVRFAASWPSGSPLGGHVAVVVGERAGKQVGWLAAGSHVAVVQSVCVLIKADGGVQDETMNWELAASPCNMNIPVLVRRLFRDEAALMIGGCEWQDERFENRNRFDAGRERRGAHEIRPSP
jgi:hypothetical protein